MSNVYMVDVSHDYYVDVARKLIEMGCSIRIVGTSKAAEYWPASLDRFIADVKPTLTLWEELTFPEEFDRIVDADYSVIGLEMMAELSYYEKMFLMSSDRLSFFPLPQIERCRLFYRLVAHFYRLLKRERIDVVLFFGTPHGLFSIALFGLAKALGLKTIYVDWVALSPELSTIETELHIRRGYTAGEMELGVAVNREDQARISEIVDRTVHAKFVWTAAKQINLPKIYAKTLASLILRRPFGKLISPEFFLDSGSRRRIGYVVPMLGYFRHVLRALRFYERHTTDELPGPRDLVLFLAHQPEAATMPLGGVFADQLLLLDVILAALPEGMRVFVKEHPFMFGHTCDVGQDRHERSETYYAHMLKDQRVRFVKRSVSSGVLIEKAGVVASIGGSVSWEAMRVGKPCLIFGWAWYAECKSCYSVDSAESVSHAIHAALAKTRESVLADVDDFVNQLKKRLVYGASCRSALSYLGGDYDYGKGVNNIARAIRLAIGSGERQAAASLPVGTANRLAR